MSRCIKLSELSIDKKGKVLNFVTEDIPMKLIEMGILPETKISVVGKAPFNGPLLIEYGEDNSRLSLRIEEANCILIEELHA